MFHLFMLVPSLVMTTMGLATSMSQVVLDSGTSREAYVLKRVLLRAYKYTIYIEYIYKMYNSYIYNII